MYVYVFCYCREHICVGMYFVIVGKTCVYVFCYCRENICMCMYFVIVGKTYVCVCILLL